MKPTAYLYCTFMHDFWYIGEIEDEGSFEELVQAHIAKTNESHRKTIHIAVEGTPEYNEPALMDDFPRFYHTHKLMQEAREIVGLENTFKDYAY